VAVGPVESSGSGIDFNESYGSFNKVDNFRKKSFFNKDRSRVAESFTGRGKVHFVARKLKVEELSNRGSLTTGRGPRSDLEMIRSESHQVLPINNKSSGNLQIYPGRLSLSRPISKNEKKFQTNEYLAPYGESTAFTAAPMSLSKSKCSLRDL